MLKATRKMTCQNRKLEKATLASKSEKRKKQKRKRFKVKTQKGSLNHKKVNKKEKNWCDLTTKKN